MLRRRFLALPKLSCQPQATVTHSEAPEHSNADPTLHQFIGQSSEAMPGSSIVDIYQAPYCRCYLGSDWSGPYQTALLCMPIVYDDITEL